MLTVNIKQLFHCFDVKLTLTPLCVRHVPGFGVASRALFQTSTNVAKRECRLLLQQQSDDAGSIRCGRARSVKGLVMARAVSGGRHVCGCRCCIPLAWCNDLWLRGVSNAQGTGTRIARQGTNADFSAIDRIGQQHRATVLMKVVVPIVASNRDDILRVGG